MCEEVVRLIRDAGLAPQRAFELEQYVRQLAGASHYIPTTESAAATKEAVRQAGIPPMDGTKRPRKLSRAERRYLEKQEAHRAHVDQLFGERPLMPSERAELAPYEPVSRD